MKPLPVTSDPLPELCLGRLTLGITGKRRGSSPARTDWDGPPPAHAGAHEPTAPCASIARPHIQAPWAW
jgi:hypothetical protein